MKNNNKGFTLVELLAVIVILAVIILIAVNAIIPQMNKARKNSFIDEVAVYAQAAEKAYVASQIDDAAAATCYTIGSSGANELNGEYVKKADTNYKGTIILNSDGSLNTIYLTNGKYYVSGATTAKVAASSVVTIDSTHTWDTSKEACPVAP